MKRRTDFIIPKCYVDTNLVETTPPKKMTRSAGWYEFGRPLKGNVGR